MFYFLFTTLLWSQSFFSAGLEAKLQNQDRVDVMVYLEEKADLSLSYLYTQREARIHYVYNQLVETAERSQKDLIQFLEEQKWDYRPFYIENAVLVKNLDRSSLAKLRQLHGIKQVGLNAAAKLSLPDTAKMPSAKILEPRRPLQIIKADKAWQEFGTKGNGIVVAGQDTGFYWQHNAIKTRYRGYSEFGVQHDYHWHDAIHNSSSRRCGSSSASPCDDKDHGTHTMGTMVGDGGSDYQIGVAPEAKWIGCRNMDYGVGSVATYLECFEFFLAPYPYGGDPRKDGKPAMAPHIVNNSWSCPPSEGCTGGEFLQAIQNVQAAGIMVVAAASNDGPSCGTINSPPGYYTDTLISVGAYNRFIDDIAVFSSRGPSTFHQKIGPTITAPGTLVVSSVSAGKDSYTDKSGTSMASPHVVGVIALLWSAAPELIGDIASTREILTLSADPIASKKTCGPYDGSGHPNAAFGYGMVNAYEAIKMALGKD